MPSNRPWRSPEALLQQIHTLKEKIDQLENLIHRVVIDQSERIALLESLTDPYSDSGEPICNRRDR